MHLTAHKRRLFAWLGLVAMCLAIGMPVVSQVMAAHRAEQARWLDVALCRVDGPLSSKSASSASAMHDSHEASMPHASHDSAGDVCGYCSLLANHPPLTMASFTGAVAFAWVARAGPVGDTLAPSPRLAFAPPARAPPALS